MLGTVRSGIAPVRATGRATRPDDGLRGCRMISAGRALRDLRAPPVAAEGERPVGVTMSPTAPAARARSIRAAIWSRLPPQYIWKNVCGLAATTSSIGLLANEQSPIAVPRAAAARATATSPSGCTACTPVGEISTGSEIGWPITVVAISRVAGSPATCGAKPELGERGHVVADGDARLGAGDQRAVDRLGQPPLARRCATATVSNHLFAIASSLTFTYRCSGTATRPGRWTWLEHALVRRPGRVRRKYLHVHLLRVSCLRASFPFRAKAAPFLDARWLA